MAPDGDQLRHHTTYNSSNSTAPKTTHTPGNVTKSFMESKNDIDKKSNFERIITDLRELKSNEIVLYGTIYNVETFHDHPGGEIPKLIGGNDATVLLDSCQRGYLGSMDQAI
jgi:hypothetical protein